MKGGKVNMNKKGGMTMLVVVGIAALIVGVLIGSQIVSPQFSPKSTSANSYVKAHSCDADNSCEVNIVKPSAGICSSVSSEMISKSLEIAGDYTAVHLKEGETIYKSESLIIPQRLLRVVSIINDTVYPLDSEVILRDEVSREEIEANITAPGIGNVEIDNEIYSLIWRDNKVVEGDEYIILNYPQSSSEHKLVDSSMCF